MTRLTRILALCVCFLSLFFSSARFAAVHAAFWDDWFKNTNVENSVNKTMNAVVKSSGEGIASRESHVDGTVGDLQSTLYLITAGPPADAMASLTEEEKRIVYERYGRGLIGDVSRATATLYSPPASARAYVADLMESAHIIPQAQAQGLGFASLDPILETWKVFRNIAYLFFVIIFLVIGFMIMFRQKLGSQTAVTAQQAIPGIIVALIVVTFSYAIAGFLIDLMYLVMYLMIGLFNPPGGTDQLNKNFLEFGWQLVTNNNGAFSTMNDAVQNFSDAVIGTGGVQAVVSMIGGLTMALIVSIAILIGVFKIFWELLKSYISIIISIATSPLLLMLGAIPGKGNFGGWLKTIIGNLAAFPTVLFALILYEMFTKHDLSTGGFLPPYLIGRGVGGAVLALVGIGIVLIIPELIKEIKKALGAEGGIWESLFGAALKQAGEGAPLGSRVGLGATGLVGGGLLGGLAGVAGAGNMRNIPTAFWQGLTKGHKVTFRGKERTIGGLSGGASVGVKAAGAATRGISQPAVPRWATDFIDRRYNPEGSEKDRALREARRLMDEGEHEAAQRKLDEAMGM